MAGKSFYKIEEQDKRMHFTLSPDVQKNIRTLQVMLGLSDEEVIGSAVESFFRENLAKLAIENELLQNSPVLSLNREKVDNVNGESLFDGYCDQLNLRGTDGKTSSIQTINLEVKSAWIEG